MWGEKYTSDFVDRKKICHIQSSGQNLEKFLKVSLTYSSSPRRLQLVSPPGIPGPTRAHSGFREKRRAKGQKDASDHPKAYAIFGTYLYKKITQFIWNLSLTGLPELCLVTLSLVLITHSSLCLDFFMVSLSFLIFTSPWGIVHSRKQDNLLMFIGSMDRPITNITQIINSYKPHYLT